MMRFPLHEQTSVHVNAEPATLFDHLDDPRRVSGHMEKPTWRTLGSAMRYSVDQHEGRSVGSVITLTGQIVGTPLYLEEVVSHCASPAIYGLVKRGQLPRGQRRPIATELMQC
jgi:hypothetical protein